MRYFYDLKNLIRDNIFPVCIFSYIGTGSHFSVRDQEVGLLFREV